MSLNEYKNSRVFNDCRQIYEKQVAQPVDLEDSGSGTPEVWPSNCTSVEKMHAFCQKLEKNMEKNKDDFKKLGKNLSRVNYDSQ